MKRIITAATLGLLLTGCSLIGSESDKTATTQTDAPKAVTLLTHDSWALPKKLVKQFEQESGYQLTIRSSGDAGTLTNRLVLSKSHPEGDVAFGVDNTFASRALDEGVFAKTEVELPTGAEAYALDDPALTPIDTGNVCLNYDKRWFKQHDVAPPSTLADLTKPAYRDLAVIPAATTSSPGLAFLLATIDEYGDGWQDYWRGLMANGAKITSGWSDAYFVDFTAGGEKGTRPIVLSYDSSPAFTLTDDKARTTTAIVEDSCAQQVEYAGVLTNAKNPAGAQAVVQWLLSEPVQQALPDNMYVFPVRADVALPTDWERFAKRPATTRKLDPAEIAGNRQQWLTDWQDITSQ